MGIRLPALIGASTDEVARTVRELATSLDTLTTTVANLDIPSPYLNLGARSIRDYESLTSGGTDWSPAMNAALTDMDGDESWLKVPSGDFPCASAITKSSAKCLVIEGAHRSSLTFGNTAGLALTYTNQARAPVLQGLHLRTTAANANKALSITGPVLSTSPYSGPKLFDLRVIGTNPGAAYWGTGIYLEDCWSADIRSPNVKGLDQAALPFSAAYGIRLHNCMDAVITNPMITHVDIGEGETGTRLSEGFQHRGGYIIANTGISLKASLARTGTAISDGHINCYTYCIDIADNYGLSVHDMHLFKTNFSSQSFSAIRLVNCRNMHIHHNRVQPRQAGSGTIAQGVVLNNSFNCTVADNTFSDWDNGQTGTGIVLVSGADYNNIHGNKNDGTNPAPALYINVSGGANNKYWGNTPAQNTSSFAAFAA